ncbi:MAG: cytochrome c maturation protein CcmE [Nitrospirota bacterium]|nr:cytochrome c maturation protein CcmE [Nitrospirota bacterium]
MKPRQKRFALVAIGLVALAGAGTLVVNAMRSNLVFFFSPSDVMEGKAPHNKAFRLGGLVEAGSVQRQADGLTVHFVVTDMKKSVPVAYKGILPDMFSEGQGAVAQGRMGADGTFTASEVLAKHDEKYMPPEVADALERAGKDPSKGQHPGGQPGGMPSGMQNGGA